MRREFGVSQLFTIDKRSSYLQLFLIEGRSESRFTSGSEQSMNKLKRDGEERTKDLIVEDKEWRLSMTLDRRRRTV